MTLTKTGFSLLGALALGSNLMIPTPVWAGDILLAVEEPAAGSTYSGISNLRGWTVGSAGIDHVELYVDGTFATNVPVGGLRDDVGNQYPSYPNSKNSGFSMAFNYSNLSAGSHAIQVRAVDREGTNRETTTNFNVTRFDNSYIADPANVNLGGASGTFDTRSISLKNMTADGKTYDVRLDWRAEAQGFVIAQITPTGQSPATDYSGVYNSTVSQTQNSCSFSVSQQTKSELKLTQNNSQLSGTESDTLSVSGTVDSLGNFSLVSGRLVQTSGNCRGESYFKYQGSFPGQTVAITIQYEYFGSCSYSNCSTSFEGSIIKSNSTASAARAMHSTGGAESINAEPLLEAGKTFSTPE